MTASVSRVRLRTEMLSVLIIAILVVCLFCAKTYASSELLEARGLLSLREKESLEQAKEIIEDYLSKRPQHVQALCLLAEAHLFYGDLLKQDAISKWEHAQSLAKTVLDLDPNSAEAHYLIAASMGRIGEAKGILRSLFMVNPMLEHLERALELDPNHAWSHYILSQLYNQLPSGPLMKGDKQLALEYAQRAYELNPSESEFSLLYAKLLIERQQKETAREILANALASPTTPWTIRLRSEAEQILQGL